MRERWAESRGSLGSLRFAKHLPAQRSSSGDRAVGYHELRQRTGNGPAPAKGRARGQPGRRWGRRDTGVGNASREAGQAPCTAQGSMRQTPDTETGPRRGARTHPSSFTPRDAGGGAPAWGEDGLGGTQRSGGSGYPH